MTTNITPKDRAILASAYNVMGPRTGAYATPDTVLEMATAEELGDMGFRYLRAVMGDRDALYTGDEVVAAIARL